jgi:hypothetical protein
MESDTNAVEVTVSCGKCGATGKMTQNENPPIPNGWGILLTQGSKYVCGDCHDAIFGPVEEA